MSLKFNDIYPKRVSCPMFAKVKKLFRFVSCQAFTEKEIHQQTSATACSALQQRSWFRRRRDRPHFGKESTCKAIQ